MDKIIYQDGNEQLLKALYKNGEALTRLIDLDGGVKSAASDLITRDVLEKYRPADDRHFLVHLIAMGDSEYYGPNRNGDWFGNAMLQKRAGTFVTHGYPFREHANRDPRKALGVVKHAAYDGGKGMHRVEILVEYDRDKAQEEYELAKSASGLNFSMSCRVTHDVCSCCGNKSKTLRNYCDHLKYSMNQYLPEFSKYAYADNPDGVFFDISRVKVPADRIARHLEYVFYDGDALKKAASADTAMISGAAAAIAEQVHLPAVPDMAGQLVLSRLAESESYAQTCDPSLLYTEKRANAVYGTYPLALLEHLDAAELEACRSLKPETFFHEMAKRACLLSFPAFCQYISGNERADLLPVVKRAAAVLPHVFSFLQGPSCRMDMPMMDEFAAGSSFAASQDSARDDFVQHFMNKMQEKFAIRGEPVRRRITAVIVKLPAGMPANVEFSKGAAAQDKDAVDLAGAYGQYQVRALCDIRDLAGEEAVGDSTYDLVAGANRALIFDR